jgi:predicted transcriptional regulator of viral defense system
MARSDNERILREVGASQHGVISRQQLLDRGIASHTIDRMVSTGRIVVLHRGVYQIGPLPARRAAETAAVLACGSESRVSHLSAATIRGIMDASDLQRTIEVTMPQTTSYRRNPNPPCAGPAR